MSRPTITRFAPSPTGFLHIGGARTALFNWLFAHRRVAGGAGKFLLRIEDTDRSRHNEAAVDAILAGLSWLELDWDGVPISQFDNAPRHVAVAHGLLEEGRAYRCWLAGVELDAAREKARAQGSRFESPWRSPCIAAPDGPYAIRLKAPDSGETVVKDLIQGEVRFPANALDDMVLLRADGTPTYMLAVVVDDYDMNISHVLRGDDHLVNAARQTQLFEALEWTPPLFAHMPLIHGADGAKLSKRHGALGVEAYRDQGYLPAALRNYLLRLGWSHGDKEIISTREALEIFDLPAVTKAPARLDIDKLDFVNQTYIRMMTDKDFISAVRPFLDTDDKAVIAALTRGAGFLKARLKRLGDINEAAAFITITRPFTLTAKAEKPLKKDGAIDIIRATHADLSRQIKWTEVDLKAYLDTLPDEFNTGFGQIGPPLRAALTNGLPSPDLAQVLYALGREESLARLDDQL